MEGCHRVIPLTEHQPDKIRQRELIETTVGLLQYTSKAVHKGTHLVLYPDNRLPKITIETEIVEHPFCCLGNYLKVDFDLFDVVSGNAQ